MKNLFINQGRFWLYIIFANWDFMLVYGGICSILGFFGVGVIDSNSSLGKRLFYAFILLVFVFIIKLIKQCNELYIGYFMPLKAERGPIKGDGCYKGYDLFVFKTSIILQKGTLVTLYCDSSGVKQPICILKIIESDVSQTIAIYYTGEKRINKYFEEDGKRKMLYAVPIINSEIFINEEGI